MASTICPVLSMLILQLADISVVYSALFLQLAPGTSFARNITCLRLADIFVVDMIVWHSATLTGTDRRLRLRLALGDFDRLVWPTIVIHKAGPTLCEYVALGCRSCFEWAPLHWQSVLNCIAVVLHWQLI